jgi:hypothetical protein
MVKESVAYSDRHAFAIPIVLGVYVLLAALPFAIAATRSSFWESEHATAPAAAAAVAALLACLVLGYRWAWLLLVVAHGTVLASYAVDFTGLLWFLATAAGFVLLISPPMRRHVSR